MSASKRDELVRKALDIFYAHGFHATGMDRLVRETGISKTSMYKHFRTKEDLIIAVLRLRDEEFRNWFVRRVERLSDNPEDALLACFDVLGEWFVDERFQSCMFIKASSEYQDVKHPIHVQAAEHKKLIITYLADLARQAGLKNPETLARQLHHLMEGAIVSAHLLGREGISAETRDAAEILINQARG